MTINLSVKYSPDGTRIAMGGSSGVLRLFAAEKQVEKSAVHIQRGIFSLDYSPDGAAIAVGGGGFDTKINGHTGYLAIHDAATGAVRATCEAEESIACVAFSPDGRTLVAGASSGLTAIDLESNQRRDMFSESARTAFLEGGHLVTLDSGEVRLVGIDGKEVRSFPEVSDFVESAAVSADGKLVTAGGQDGVLRVWNAADGKTQLTLKAQ